MKTAIIIAIAAVVYFVAILFVLRFIAFTRRCDDQLRLMRSKKRKRLSLHPLS